MAEKTRDKKTMVSASELSQMGACERLVLFEAIHGKRTSPCQQEAIERGRAEHDKFFKNGVRSGWEVQTSLSKPWCFFASLAWGPEAPETDLLRRFRDRILRRTAASRWLIRAYYRTAPGLCRRLKGRRTLIRALCLGLKPALWIAKAALAMRIRRRSVTMGGFLLFILLAVAGLVALKLTRIWRARASERHWLPRELQHAQLAFAEKTFRTWRPIRLIARADRGYRLNGVLHLTEFKTRKRAVAYASDVIELSAQRLVIEKSAGELVSEIGYVLAQHPSVKRRSVHKVRLLPTADVVALARRREAILKGRVIPRYTGSQGLCRHCAYRPECEPDLRDRG